MINSRNYKSANQKLQLKPQFSAIIYFHLIFGIGLLIILCNQLAINYNMKRQPPKSSNKPSLLPKGIKNKRKPPPKIIVNLKYTSYKIIEEICRELNYQCSYTSEKTYWDIIWRDAPISTGFLANMSQNQKINHFPGMFNLTKKGELIRHLKRMRNAFPELYTYFPQTFVLPQDKLALKRFQDIAKMQGFRPTFIIKPEDKGQGESIYLWQYNVDLQVKRQVVQLYIQRPLLYRGLKFDLRVYVLMTGCSPLRLYIYNEGLIRLATVAYQRPNEQNIQNVQMHLTSQQINKTSQKYIENDSVQDLCKGHKLSLAQFFQVLTARGFPAEYYWTEIQSITVRTMIAALPQLKKEYQTAQPYNKVNTMCFQLLALDFLIENNHKVYLLQINQSPSLNVDTPLDYLISSNLIKDTLQIVKKEHELRASTNQKGQNNDKNRENSFEITSSDISFSRKIQFPPIDDKQKKYDPKLPEQYLGSFQRIYPTQNQKEYNHLISYSLSTINLQSGVAKNRSQSFSQRKNIHLQSRNDSFTNERQNPYLEKTKASRSVRSQPQSPEVLSPTLDSLNYRQYLSNRNQSDNRKNKNSNSEELDPRFKYLRSIPVDLEQSFEQNKQGYQTPKQSYPRLVKARKNY